MKALSLTQPWAELMVLGAKKIETRSWRTNFRGLCAIHAAKTFPKNARLLCDIKPFNIYVDQRALTFGAIIGVVEFIDCQPTSQDAQTLTEHERFFGSFEPGRFMFKAINQVRFANPIFCRGALGFWIIPDDVHEILKDRL